MLNTPFVQRSACLLALGLALATSNRPSCAQPPSFGASTSEGITGPSGDSYEPSTSSSGSGSVLSLQTQPDGTQAARIYVADPDTPIAVQDVQGRRVITIQDRQGRRIYQGPLNSKADTSNIPANLRANVCSQIVLTCESSMQGMWQVWNTPGMREQLDADPRISQAWVDRFFDSTQVKVFAGEAGVGQAGVALGGGDDAAEEGNWKLTSDAFNDEAALPVEHTRYGANKSPSLLWGEPPAGTMEFALICEDGTADSSTHWVVYGIPVDVRELPVGLPRTPALPKHSGIKQGKNDFGTTGYAGPRPTKGSGPQTYRFRLLALDCAVSTKPNPTKDALNAAMEGHILDEFTLSCVFEKP